MRGYLDERIIYMVRHVRFLLVSKVECTLGSIYLQEVNSKHALYSNIELDFWVCDKGGLENCPF